MIDSKIEPQPGEGRGINTINQEGPGLQKEEPDAGAALPDRDGRLGAHHYVGHVAPEPLCEA